NTVTFHLAQRQAGEGLTQIQVNQNTSLYALRQPVFTQADLQQIVPVQTKDGQTFLRFDFNPQGAAKLAKVAQQAKGNYFLVSVRGRLVGVPQIAPTYEGGRFPLRVNNAADAQAILQRLRQPQQHVNQPRTQPGQPSSGQRR